MPSVSSNNSENQTRNQPGRDRNGSEKNSPGRGDDRSLQGGTRVVANKGVAPCQLHRTSPSVCRATRVMGSISSLFPGLMNCAVKKVVESTAINARYYGNSVVYTPVSRMRRFPPVLAYRFPLGDEGGSYGYILFDQRLPDCLTDICFGASASALSAAHASAATDPADSVAASLSLSKIGQHLLQKVASELASAWMKAWSRYFPDSCRDQVHDPMVSAEWLGGIASGLEPFKEDCLESRFYLEFSEQGQQGPALQVPVSIYMPVNPLGHVLSAKGDRLSLSSTSARITRCLLITGVNITADLATVSLSLAEAGRLQAGDVIPIPRLGQATLRMADVPLFDGVVAQHSGYLTLQISGPDHGGDGYD